MLAQRQRLVVGLARVFALGGVLSAGCEATGTVEVDVTADPSGAARTTSVPARARVTIYGDAPGGLVDFEIDCHPPLDNPDAVGFRFAIDAPALGVAADEPERAGYFRKRAVVAKGAIAVVLDAKSGPASCAIRLTPAATACGPLSVFHSINVDHAHVPTNAVPSTWEKFPVSGDHYPIWAAWNMSYGKAIRTGYLLHDLEHGGIVLSYRCTDAQQSAACTQAQADLLAARTAFPSMRANDTPDPAQPALYAARTWRWGLLADCLDRAELDAFMSLHFRHGREDIDGDYPTPFDPTQ